MNIIDACWRKDPSWSSNRKALANCAKGYGADAQGGKNGEIYVVNDPSDDPINPQKGTLRYGVIQTKPLWIIFEHDMTIKLDGELLVNNYKTIDGRGAKIEIANGVGIRIENANHVIVHGIKFHRCVRAKPGLARIDPKNVVNRTNSGSDGDAIRVTSSTNVWIDHCHLSNSVDGLLDISHGNAARTFRQAPRGRKDYRVRFGYAHIANNKYDPWLMYAIGGSSNPTVMSEGNHFTASNDPDAKEVTKRITDDPNWKNWKWNSKNDLFLNGAFFVSSGGNWTPTYSKVQAFGVSPAEMVPPLTNDAGPLNCIPNQPC
ncbi:hypothetical protein ACH5RR_014771 [Cinchona calisaya]|uniref:Pectate lyase n=1 Tax=Cinchona calisaya TaxID=153742 RepID=A0ABD2ZR84_9GENT